MRCLAKNNQPYFSPLNIEYWIFIWRSIHSHFLFFDTRSMRTTKNGNPQGTRQREKLWMRLLQIQLRSWPLSLQERRTGHLGYLNLKPLVARAPRALEDVLLLSKSQPKARPHLLNRCGRYQSHLDYQISPTPRLRFPNSSPYSNSDSVHQNCYHPLFSSVQNPPHWYSSLRENATGRAISGRELRE